MAELPLLLQPAAVGLFGEERKRKDSGARESNADGGEKIEQIKRGGNKQREEMEEERKGGGKSNKTREGGQRPFSGCRTAGAMLRATYL